MLVESIYKFISRKDAKSARKDAIIPCFPFILLIPVQTISRGGRGVAAALLMMGIVLLCGPLFLCGSL